ncbi:MAG: 50S ribosomal protein L15 [Firmicutes bacterium]|nr:50S ribosomal protein L15 [Bacillota bacterium]
MRLNELHAPEGARHAKKRVGRGIGSGHGKTAGRGTKGQGARSGGNVRPGFEGGQMPITRRLPKRGFKNPNHKEYVAVNVGRLERFDAGTVVTPQLLLQERVVSRLADGIKILGGGEISKPLTVQAAAFSETAAAKIAAAGGKAEVI